MRLLLLITMNLHSQVLSRKHESSSDESIENLLYYKDCSHKSKDEAAQPVVKSAPEPPPQPECPFPKMCCSMSCGNECGNPQSFFGRQMEPLQYLQPIQTQPRQPPHSVQPKIMQRGRKKNLNVPVDMQLPMARRGLGLTKEKIKNLIAQDNDIRKILKDLVRVTMQKVDLIEIVNSRRKAVTSNPETSLNSEDYDSYIQ